MEALKIIAGSWPLAVAFGILVFGTIANKIVAIVAQSREEDRSDRRAAALREMKPGQLVVLRQGERVDRAP